MSSCHAGRKKVGEMWCIGRSGEARSARRLPWRAIRSEKLTRVGGSVHAAPPALAAVLVMLLMHAAGDWLLLDLVGSLLSFRRSQARPGARLDLPSLPVGANRCIDARVSAVRRGHRGAVIGWTQQILYETQSLLARRRAPAHDGARSAKGVRVGSHALGQRPSWPWP